MKRSSFLKRAVGVGVALTALDGVKLEKLFTERDDSAYIQSLVNRGGTIHFPPGKYTFTRPVKLMANSRLIGHHEGTIFIADESNPPKYLFFVPGGNSLQNMTFGGRSALGFASAS